MKRALLLALPVVFAGCAMPGEGATAYDTLDDGGSPEAAVAPEAVVGHADLSPVPIEIRGVSSPARALGDETSVWSTFFASGSAQDDPFRDSAPSSLHFAPPTPGRYAMVIRDGYTGGCSRSRVRSDSLAAVSLVLARNGGATACRARQSQSTTTSMELVPTPGGEGLRRSSGYVRTEREQRGYRGAWSRDGSAMVLVLRRDDSVCAPLTAGGARPPETWRLRCAAAGAHDEGITLPGAGLACTVPAEPWEDNHGYTVRSLDNATTLWMLLGPERGWQIRAEGMRIAGYGRLEITRAAARIDVPHAVDLGQPMSPF